MHWLAIGGCLMLSGLALGVTAKAEETQKTTTMVWAMCFDFVLVPVAWFWLGRLWP